MFLYFFRNGIKVDSSYTTSGRDSSNTYSFLAATEDNNAKFRCESSNELSTEPLTAEIVLSVQCKSLFLFHLLFYFFFSSKWGEIRKKEKENFDTLEVYILNPHILSHNGATSYEVLRVIMCVFTFLCVTSSLKWE